MTFTELKYFNAVYTALSVSGAAEILHISQPSVSGAIKQLEKDFGVTLFKRHHKGVTPTPEGESLFKMSKDILTRVAEAENIMKEMGSECKTLRLGIPPMVSSLILPEIFRDFVKNNPDISLSATEGGYKELKEKLENGYIDMAFLPHNSPFENEISAIHTMRFEMVCAVGTEHMLSKEKAITPQMLKDVSLVLFDDGFFQTEKIKNWFQEKAVSPQIILQTAQLSSLLNMLKNNMAAGFVFKTLAEKDASLTPLKTNPPLYTDVSLVWKKDAYFSLAMKKFCEYVISFFNVYYHF